MSSTLLALTLSLSALSAKSSPTKRKVFDPSSLQMDRQAVLPGERVGFRSESSTSVPDSLVFDLECAQVVPGIPLRWEASDSLVAHRVVSGESKNRWEAIAPRRGIWRLSLRRASAPWR